MKAALIIGAVLCIVAIAVVLVQSPLYEEVAITQVMANRMRSIFIFILFLGAVIFACSAAIVASIERAAAVASMTNSYLVEINRNTMSDQQRIDLNKSSSNKRYSILDA